MGPLVRAALRAAAERALEERWLAAERACFESELEEAAECPSRFSACEVARDRLADAFARAGAPCPRAKARAALLRVLSDVAPFAGGFRLTPARRAFDKPIAIACFVERAPCLPARMCSISSRTNSPACVLGAVPARLSLRARSIV